MINPKEIYDKFIILQANIDRMLDDLSSMEGRIRAVETRMVRIEGTADLTVEKAKNAAINQTFDAMMRVTTDIERMKTELSQVTSLDEETKISAVQGHLKKIANSD